MTPSTISLNWILLSCRHRVTHGEWLEKIIIKHFIGDEKLGYKRATGQRIPPGTLQLHRLQYEARVAIIQYWVHAAQQQKAGKYPPISVQQCNTNHPLSGRCFPSFLAASSREEKQKDVVFMLVNLPLAPYETYLDFYSNKGMEERENTSHCNRLFLWKTKCKNSSHTHTSLCPPRKLPHGPHQEKHL